MKIEMVEKVRFKVSVRVMVGGQLKMFIVIGLLGTMLFSD